MTQSEAAADSERPLPLTEPFRSDAPNMRIDEGIIRTPVDTFYDTVRGDDLLGPVFARPVADLSLHLPKMYGFWSTVVLHTGRYSGRPLEAHRRLPGLTQAHFDRWIALSFLTTTTTPRLRADFKSGVLGDPEFYMLRWSTRGTKCGRGWMDVAKATVAANPPFEHPSLPGPGVEAVLLSGGLNAVYDVRRAAAHLCRLGRVVHPGRRHAVEPLKVGLKRDRARLAGHTLDAEAM